jgi:putative DNA primase/helicase
MNAQRQQRVEECARRSEAAREEALRQWKAAESADPDHRYLVNKQVKPYGIRQRRDGKLLVPMYDKDSKLRNVETIGKDGRKLFLKGGPVSGCYFRIGPKDVKTVCIVEGYATAASIHEATKSTVFVAFDAGNLINVAKIVRERYPDAKIILCADDDWKTNGNPGVTAATKAARAVKGFVAVPKFAENRGDHDTDFNDLMRAEGAAAVKKCIDAAVLVDDSKEGEMMTKEEEAKFIAELAKLGRMEYDRALTAAAKRLKVREATLNKEVKDVRAVLEADDSKGGFLTPVTPWKKPVDGNDLLIEIANVLDRHVIFSRSASTAAALWIMHAHAHDAATHSPNFMISSPTPRCGKTTLLRLISRLVPKPLSSANVTPAVVFRAIDRWHPTLCLDEADTIKKDNHELRGILNSGHERSQSYTLRCVGDDHEPRRFTTWAPKCISLIGRMHPTLEDRSIRIEMRRRLPTAENEKIERLPKLDSKEILNLLRKCARWAQDHVEALGKADPALPKELNDRAADNWRPLLAIADAVGGDWPNDARQAAIKLSKVDDNEVHGIQLLADIRVLFEQLNENAKKTMSSLWIAEELGKMEDRPWAEYSHNKPITAAGLARLLKPFNISPRQIKMGDDHNRTKGYSYEQCRQAFERYLPQGGHRYLYPHQRHINQRNQSVRWQKQGHHAV